MVHSSGVLRHHVNDLAGPLDQVSETDGHEEHDKERGPKSTTTHQEDGAQTLHPEHDDHCAEIGLGLHAADLHRDSLDLSGSTHSVSGATGRVLHPNEWSLRLSHDGS